MNNPLSITDHVNERAKRDDKYSDHYVAKPDEIFEQKVLHLGGMIFAVCLCSKAVVLEEVDKIGRGHVEEDVLQIEENCKEKCSF